MRFCPYCGHSVDDTVLYCPSCGKKLPTAVAGVPPGSVAPPPPPGTPYYAPNIPPMYGEADTKALRKLMIFAIIILVGFVVSIASSFLFNFLGYLLLVNPATAGSRPSFTFSSNFLTYFIVYFIVALVVEIVTLLQLRIAFKTLSTVDKPRFKTPAFLTLLLMIALPIVLVGVVIEFAGLFPYLNTILQRPPGQTTPPPFPTSGLGEFFAGAILAFIGGIIALIGAIGGMLLGIWRMGSRYDETLFKVAAILFIIPLLNIASPILILIGVSQARKKIVAAPTMP